MSILRIPNNGTAVVDNRPNSPELYYALYIPDYDFIGIDSFVYAISDADGKSSNATVIVGVRLYNEE